MYNYWVQKRVAFALKNITCNSIHQVRDDYTYTLYDEIEIVKSIEKVSIFPSKYHNYKVIEDYFRLFHLPYSKFNSCGYDPKYITNRLKLKLKHYDLLIGIPTVPDIFNDKENLNYSFEFYQLLIYFLKVFGKIGLVPLIGGQIYRCEAAVLPLPYAYVGELSNFDIENLIIPGETILKIIVDKHDKKIKSNPDVTAYYNYWEGSDDIPFTEYMRKNYNVLVI